MVTFLRCGALIVGDVVDKVPSFAGRGRDERGIPPLAPCSNSHFKKRYIVRRRAHQIRAASQLFHKSPFAAISNLLYNFIDTRY